MKKSRPGLADHHKTNGDPEVAAGARPGTVRREVERQTRGVDRRKRGGTRHRLTAPPLRRKKVPLSDDSSGWIRAVHRARPRATPSRHRAVSRPVGCVVRDGVRVLLLGCGWDLTRVTLGLRDRAEIVGVDLDRSAGARYHSLFWWADAANLPFGDGTIDVVCSEYVFEHVEQPMAVMAELGRVVCSGGSVVALTPNRWSYKSLTAAATPTGFHRMAAARLRPDARAAVDFYPTGPVID